MTTIKPEIEFEWVQETTNNPVQPTQTVYDFNSGLKSDIWKEFKPVGLEEDGKERCCCIHCGTKLVIGTNHGTSTLRRHIRSCLNAKPIKTDNTPSKKRRQSTNETIATNNSQPPTQEYFGSNPRLTADAWKEFVPLGIEEDGKERCRCIHCGTKFVIGKNHGTSTLRRHLKKICRMKPRNVSESDDGTVVCDRELESDDVVEDLVVCESSCDDMEGVSDVVLEKREVSLVSEGKTRSAMLMGLDILDCPICFEALTIPVFQCDNGHLACSSCCPELNNECPTCALPIGHNRNRAIEIVLESSFVPCPNANLGCTEKISYGKESTHENECPFSQCTCPASDCSFNGPYNQIYTHFIDNHHHNDEDKPKSLSFVCGSPVDVQMNMATNKMLVLWESEKKLLFALQCFDELYHGVYVTVRCIAPSASEVEKLSYCLYYSLEGETLSYKSTEVKRVLGVSYEIPQDSFLFVPRCLLRGEVLEIKLCIGLRVRTGC